MGKKKNLDSQTVFAQLREEYNETHSKTISLEELGKQLGISRATVGRIENGEADPKEPVLRKYCEIFNVTMEYLTGTQTTVEMENNAYLKSLGITDDTYKTLKKIREISNDTNNLSAVVNAFLSNEEYAVCFFQSILSYLQLEFFNQQNGYTDNGQQHDFLIRTFEEYINNVVKPQLQTAIKKNNKMKELISEVPDEKRL